ncbi:MAG: TRAP transporter small permease subunit [Inquilinus sp.]|nr:TRAP transporter small permease subunit [Inquilinus sp.]
MKTLLSASAAIDRVLSAIARLGGWCGAVLVLVVCYDVVTRYFGVPKPFGLNSTQIQESEYWLHAFLIVLTIGYAYLRQAHVRIDLLRDGRPRRIKYIIEICGILLFLMPYSALGLWLSWPYAVTSFLQGEVSKSQIGMTDIWILKGSLVLLFVLMGLAAVSQLIKSVAGLLGKLPDRLVAETLGGEF